MTVLPAVRGVSPFLPLVVHAPHAGTHVPVIARENALDCARMRAELNRLTDWYTADLFQLPGASLCATPVSRLVVDLERYTDDTLEPRAAVGQGVIYTHDSQGQRLRPELAPEQRRQWLDHWYRPWHLQLELDVLGSLHAAPHGLPAGGCPQLSRAAIGQRRRCRSPAAGYLPGYRRQHASVAGGLCAGLVCPPGLIGCVGFSLCRLFGACGVRGGPAGPGDHGGSESRPLPATAGPGGGALVGGGLLPGESGAEYAVAGDDGAVAGFWRVWEWTALTGNQGRFNSSLLPMPCTAFVCSVAEFDGTRFLGWRCGLAKILVIRPVLRLCHGHVGDCGRLAPAASPWALPGRRCGWRGNWKCCRR